ncbi:uncharacterized protein LOC117179122 [Belonocnema kinseyi]|uniref:uncharacterized protein LOC117179122 n=1 Tax=Belonocnema kinseyi TaxID=2817044 RepID=UPI00143DFFE5|nr:uncharacterized protein LOC117179122 [Belonocnema kinseyi]
MNKEESDHQEESFLNLKKSSVSIFGAFKDACNTRPSSVNTNSNLESTNQDNKTSSRDFSTYLLMDNEIAHRHRTQQEIENLNQKMIKNPVNLHSSLSCLNQENQASLSNQQLQGQFMSQRSTSEQMLTCPGSILDSVAASGTRKKKIPLRKRSKSMTAPGSSSESMNLVQNSLLSTNFRRMNATSDQGQYQYLHQEENNFPSNQQTTPARRKRKLLSLAEDEVDRQEDKVDTCENEQPIDLTTIIEVFNCM